MIATFWPYHLFWRHSVADQYFFRIFVNYFIPLSFCSYLSQLVWSILFAFSLLLLFLLPTASFFCWLTTSFFELGVISFGNWHRFATVVTLSSWLPPHSAVDSDPSVLKNSGVADVGHDLLTFLWREKEMSLLRPLVFSPALRVDASVSVWEWIENGYSSAIKSLLLYFRMAVFSFLSFFSFVVSLVDLPVLLLLLVHLHAPDVEINRKYFWTRLI